METMVNVKTLALADCNNVTILLVIAPHGRPSSAEPESVLIEACGHYHAAEDVSYVDRCWWVVRRLGLQPCGHQGDWLHSCNASESAPTPFLIFDTA